MAINRDEFLGWGDLIPGATALDQACALAMTHQLSGELDHARQIYRAVLHAEPRHAAANYCMGMLLLQSDQPAECLPHLLTALATDPQKADYWLGLLEALLLAGHTQEAANTLALARQRGLSGRAADAFAERLTVKISALAQQLEAQVRRQVTERQFERAQSSARELTVRFPERGQGWKALGALLAADNCSHEALFAMQRAVELLPTDAEALFNLGATLNERKEFKKAEACLRKAIEVNPEFGAACAELGVALISLERYPEAEAMYRRAVAASKPDGNPTCDLRHHSSLLFLLSHNPAFDAAGLFAEHLVIGRLLDGQWGQARTRFLNKRQPKRRLKIGFVSGDFRNHALANFLEPILEKLQAHTDLELHAYYNYKGEDDTSRRLRNGFTQWHSVISLSDLELVELIGASRIDILIDLSSHTAFNRLQAFANRAAPIQVSWLGFPGTTGLKAMDYYLADRHFLPHGQFDKTFTEKLVHLPAAWTFAPHVNSPPVNRLPALDAGFVTFGSFNRSGKINPFTVHLWSRLLNEVPNSILVMIGIPGDEQRRSLTKLFEAENIVAERLAFFPRSNIGTYLELHNQVDMCLDTFPYTGGTTTNHALWMGVPTLTMTGETPASRQGAANLAHVGLDGFTAADPDDFVAKGLYWSTHVAALAEVRSGLRERWLNSPLRQPEALAAALDAALRHMWQRWCRDLPAHPFSITASNQVSQ